jgi:hypothetical protein
LLVLIVIGSKTEDLISKEYCDANVDATQHQTRFYRAGEGLQYRIGVSPLPSIITEQIQSKGIAIPRIPYLISCPKDGKRCSKAAPSEPEEFPYPAFNCANETS